MELTSVFRKSIIWRLVLCWCWPGGGQCRYVWGPGSSRVFGMQGACRGAHLGVKGLL